MGNRSPIIYPNNHRPAIAQVGHFHQSSQRQLPVSSRELEHIITFPAGSFFPVELLAIPRSLTDLIGLRAFHLARAYRCPFRIVFRPSFLGSYRTLGLIEVGLTAGDVWRLGRHQADGR